jgi:hypothetical protein
MTDEKKAIDDAKNMAELQELTGKMMPMLAGRGPQMQANVLVSMTVTWLMGFSPKRMRPSILVDYIRALIEGYSRVAMEHDDEDDDEPAAHPTQQ